MNDNGNKEPAGKSYDATWIVMVIIGFILAILHLMGVPLGGIFRVLPR